MTNQSINSWLGSQGYTKMDMDLCSKLMALKETPKLKNPLPCKLS
jgi:hypothetical protein